MKFFTKKINILALEVLTRIIFKKSPVRKKKVPEKCFQNIRYRKIYTISGQENHEDIVKKITILRIFLGQEVLKNIFESNEKT